MALTLSAPAAPRGAAAAGSSSSCEVRLRSNSLVWPLHLLPLPQALAAVFAFSVGAGFMALRLRAPCAMFSVAQAVARVARRPAAAAAPPRRNSGRVRSSPWRRRAGPPTAWRCRGRASSPRCLPRRLPAGRGISSRLMLELLGAHHRIGALARGAPRAAWTRSRRRRAPAPRARRSPTPPGPASGSTRR